MLIRFSVAVANVNIAGYDARDAHDQAVVTVRCRGGRFRWCDQADRSPGSSTRAPAVNLMEVIGDGLGDTLAIDISRRRLGAGVVDDRGQVIIRDRVANPARDAWPALERLVARVLAANPSKRPPTRCGVTAPGPFDHENGVMKPIGLPAWSQFSLRDNVTRAVGLPTSVDTAGRGMAEAEMWCGDYSGAPSAGADSSATRMARPESRVVEPGKGIDLTVGGRITTTHDGSGTHGGSGAVNNFATLVLGDDVDGGVVSGGQMLMGRTGNLGQFGHIVVEPDGEMCICGSAGCLTAYASVPGIAATTNRDLRRTPPSIIERTGIMVGRACASIAALTDATELVIGGAVPETFGRPFFEALDLELDRRLGAEHLADFRVRPASQHVGPLVAAAAVGRRRPPA